MKVKALISSFIFILFYAANSVAIDLNVAKEKGLVGEMATGYLGAPGGKPSPEVHALIKDINGKRKRKFAEVAKKQGVSVDDVANIFAEKAAAKTKAGHFVQKSNGQWVKR